MSDTSENINPWLAGGILAALIAIFITSGLIVKRVYYDMPTPRTALERDLVTYEARVAKTPDDAAARVGLAQVHYRLGDERAAIDELETAAKISPDLWEVHFTRGLIDLDSKRTTPAIQAFERAKKADPRNALSYFELGQIYLKRKHYRLSVENLREAVRLDRGMADAHYSLGLAYERLGDKKQARVHFSEALKYVPGMRQAKIARERVSE